MVKNKHDSQPGDGESNGAANSVSSTHNIKRQDSKGDDDNTSLDERLMIESFKSITDRLEKEENLAKNNEKQQDQGDNCNRRRSYSEGSDSMDEEVKRIMSHSGTYDRVKKASKNVIYHSEKESSEDVYSDNDIEGDQSDSVSTETESESESDLPFTDSDEEEGNETETSANDWSVRKNDDDEETETSDQEEFDLDKYIDKLCLQSTDDDYSENETDIESDNDSTYSNDTKKAVKKVMKNVRKNSSDNEYSISESENSDDNDDTTSSPDVNDDYEDTDDASSVKENDNRSNDESDDSSYISSNESDVDYLYDDSDDDDSSTDMSQNDDVEMEEREGLDHGDVTQINSDGPFHPSDEPGYQPHDAVSRYYNGFEQDRCPVKIDVDENEIGRLSLDRTLSSRSVVSLRWPYTNYYVKELNIEHEERDSVFDEGLVPTYKSLRSSASFPGRRRDVMSGRIWWVEWWARSHSDIDSSTDFSVGGLQAKQGNDDICDIEQRDDDSIDESTHL